ncbi:MAG: GNAT family N-acetyltransferase [Sedimenticola sp.]|nr:GNAT family N-acetyltransferase [Sedimenticola sp.]
MADLEFEFSLRPDSDPVLARYVVQFIGKAIIWDDASGTDRVVGEIHGHKLDLAAAIIDGVEQGLLLDSVCPELSEFSNTAFGDNGCYYLQEMADGTLEKQQCSGLVYINEISVEPDYRGRQIGTELMSKIGQLVDVEDSIIALKAFPLSEEYGRKVPEESVERVKRFYERLGFTHIGGEFMVKQANLCDSIRKRLAWRKSQPLASTPDRLPKRPH